MEVARKNDAWLHCDEVYRHLNQTDAYAEAAHLGNGIELLVSRHDRHHVVAGVHQRREHERIGPRGAVGGNNVLGLNRAVELGNAGKQVGAALSGHDLSLGCRASGFPGRAGANQEGPLPLRCR
mgnify:CR=1 FL=1